MSAIVKIKRGDSLLLHCQLKTDGQPVDIGGWQVNSQIRDRSGALVHTFAATITDASIGTFDLAATPEQTMRWPLGGLSADLRYQDAAARVMHSATWPVRVVQEITT